MPYKDPDKARARARERYHDPEVRESRASWRKANKDIVAQRNRANYDAMGPEARREKHDGFLAAHPGYKQAYHLQHRYGLSLDAYHALLRGQGNKCASCGTDNWGASGPHVDHDHATGAVRGILCAKCNQAAGMLDDNPAKARSLADYLEASGVRKP